MSFNELAAELVKQAQAEALRDCPTPPVPVTDALMKDADELWGIEA
jgi:hypothetical protein